MKYRVRIPVQVETVDGHEMPSVGNVSLVVEAGCVREAIAEAETILAREAFRNNASK